MKIASSAFTYKGKSLEDAFAYTRTMEGSKIGQVSEEASCTDELEDKTQNEIKELSAVEERIRRSLYDAISTMCLSTIIYAPPIAGIALDEVITKIQTR